MIPVARVEINPGASGAWTDIDVTAHLGGDAGNVAGVVLEVVSTALRDCMIRKNGSGDTYVSNHCFAGHYWCAVGIDGSDIFEAYLQDHTATTIYLVAYILNIEGGFLLNHVDKSPAAAAWNDVDISGDTGADTAVCAFFFIESAATEAFGIRNNGSGDARNQSFDAPVVQGAFMSVDGAEKCEVWRQTVNTKVWLMGWLTSSYTSWVNAKDYATAVEDAWVEVDFSGDIPAGNSGACCDMHSTSAFAYPWGLRKNGAGYDNYLNFRYHQYGWVEIDANRKAEQKIDRADRQDLYLFGYTKVLGLPPSAPSAPWCESNPAPAYDVCLNESTPEFSAIFEDPNPGDTATDVQICVATTEALLNADTPDMWNSGWIDITGEGLVEGNRCADQSYGGLPLSPYTVYWWKIRFKDADGNTGAWSANTSFRTASPEMVDFRSLI